MRRGGTCVALAGRVYALDARGQRQGEVPVKQEAGVTRFSIGPAQKTLWHEIEAE